MPHYLYSPNVPAMVGRMIASFVAPGIGTLLTVAALRKVTISPAFKAAVATWPFVPVSFRRIVTRTIPLVEATVAAVSIVAALFVPWLRVSALILAAVLFLTFAAAQVVIASQKLDVQCGCFSSGRVGTASVVRAGSLGLLCALVAAL